MDNTNITAGTIARTAVLALALINQGLSIAGHPILPIEDQQIEQFVSLGCTIAASVVGWWKNNSITLNARKADTYLKQLNNK